MKTFLYLRGCDDNTSIPLPEFDDKEIKFLENLCELSKKYSTYGCKPDMKIVREGNEDYEDCIEEVEEFKKLPVED